MSSPSPKRSTRHPLQHLIPILVYLLYILIPTDLVPDFIPIAGWLDDAAAALLLISEIAKSLHPIP
jgi:uncharacterized membrane protein YkvA (DUF1232 family)